MSGLTERCADRIAGMLSCPDRVVIQRTLPTACYADGMTRFLNARKIRIFDYAEFTKPLKETIRENAERVAAEAGVEIEFIRNLKSVRKEDRIQEILETRGDHPGLVHVFSAMESCTSYKPWNDEQTHRTFLKPDSGKCLHDYFDFIDEEFGLCDLRVPTWCPFRLQFPLQYRELGNGHNWLARQLEKQGLSDTLLDNAFLAIDDWDQAQQIADGFDVTKLHRRLDKYAKRLCPVLKTFGERDHWSLMQSEYATDLVFHRAEDLAPLYDEITRTAIHAVKAEQVATFLGKKLQGNYEAEMGTNFHTRIEGTCIKHHAAGKAAIKLYDKFGRVLRIETTVNDVGFFRHDREVEHRDGTTRMEQAPVRKTIYSLPVLAQLSRLLKRLRTHGLIKKVGRTSKYDLTKLGQQAVIAATKLRETLLVPTFAPAATA